jgi:hypothetical protein
MADEDKRKHLDLLQGAISRMAANSFLLKGWSVTLATALLGLSAKDARPGFALLALMPILTFWGLDAYYLALEKKFRDLYDVAINLTSTDFKMAPGEVRPREGLNAAARPAALCLHLPLAVVALVVFALLHRC